MSSLSLSQPPLQSRLLQGPPQRNGLGGQGQGGRKGIVTGIMNKSCNKEAEEVNDKKNDENDEDKVEEVQQQGILQNNSHSKVEAEQ